MHVTACTILDVDHKGMGGYIKLPYKQNELMNQSSFENLQKINEKCNFLQI